MPVSKQLRIAFVYGFDGVYTDRLIRGMAKTIAAMQKDSIDFRLRDFPMTNDVQSLPAGFEAWSPHAVITYLSRDYESFFELFKRGGRPVIHNSVLAPGEGEAVVIADANASYRVIYEHFRAIGRERIAGYFVSASAGGKQRIALYRAFCQSHGYPCEIITAPHGLAENYNDRDCPLNLDSDVAKWLSEIDEPVGIFTIENMIAGHLCRLCQQLGLRVPQDVAIIGTDGFEQSAWANPPQTGLCYDTEQVAGRTVRLALDLINGKPLADNIIRVGGAYLVVRSSTVVKENQGLDIQKALRFIDEHVFDGVTMNDIVEYTQGVSRQTFVKHFKAQTGMTPNDAIRERKVDEARRLLRDTEVSITTLAGTCGFCDDGHFRRVFSQVVGCTPRAYRKMQRGH